MEDNAIDTQEMYVGRINKVMVENGLLIDEINADDRWSSLNNKLELICEDLQEEFCNKLYKEFAIGAIPKLGKIPGFLLKKPLKKRLADCDESVLKSLAASMKTQDNRPAVGQITVPVTYFYADPGSLFSPALADWYKEHVVTPYKAVCFPKSTHMLVIDYPEKFAEEVSAVLRA